MKIKLQVHHVKRDMHERLPPRDEMVMIWNEIRLPRQEYSRLSSAQSMSFLLEAYLRGTWMNLDEHSTKLKSAGITNESLFQNAKLVFR